MLSPNLNLEAPMLKKLVVLFLAVAMTTLADGIPSTESDTTAVRLIQRLIRRLAQQPDHNFGHDHSGSEGW